LAAFSLKLPDWMRAPDWMRGGIGLPGLRGPLLEPKYPSVAFDLDPKSLAMVRIGSRKKERFIASFEVEEIPPDMLETDFYKVKLSAPDEFKAMISRLVEREPVKLNRVSLILPDNYARVAIIPFDDLPRRRQDAIALVKWKTKKSVPFKVEEAAVDFMPLSVQGRGVNVLAVLTPRSVMEEFETTFASLGIQAGLVDLSTLSLINFYRPVLQREMGNGSEYLLANVSESFLTFVIFRGEEMVFFRCRPFASGVADDGGEGALRLLKRELQTSLLYYREKLEGRQLTRAYLRIVGLDPDAVSDLLVSQAEVEDIARIDPKQVVDVDGRLSGPEGERTLQRLAPALGATLGRGAA
jgi:type IV pilus assembly protein PilM